MLSDLLRRMADALDSSQRIEDKLDTLLHKVNVMSKQLDDLEAQVKATETVMESAVTLIRGLADQVISLKDDPARLQILGEELKTKADTLAQAINDNTPAPQPVNKTKSHGK